MKTTIPPDVRKARALRSLEYVEGKLNKLRRNRSAGMWILVPFILALDLVTLAFSGYAGGGTLAALSPTGDALADVREPTQIPGELLSYIEHLPYLSREGRAFVATANARTRGFTLADAATFLAIERRHLAAIG